VPGLPGSFACGLHWAWPWKTQGNFPPHPPPPFLWDDSFWLSLHRKWASRKLLSYNINIAFIHCSTGTQFPSTAEEGGVISSFKRPKSKLKRAQKSLKDLLQASLLSNAEVQKHSFQAALEY
jgi:hypothetical protein